MAVVVAVVVVAVVVATAVAGVVIQARCFCCCHHNCSAVALSLVSYFGAIFCDPQLRCCLLPLFC